MKIKDLLSSNQVAGEGILRWSIQDTHGASVVIELMGYHIPNAEVRLLSPQVLLSIFGGQYYANKAESGSVFGEWVDPTRPLVSTKSPSLVTVCAQ